MQAARPVELTIYRSRLPMRSFEHAAARRAQAEAVLCRVRLRDGREGWGETLPRTYVTGETIESVCDDLQAVCWPAVAGRTLTAENLQETPPRCAPDGRCINAAACALELAVLDATDGFRALGKSRRTIAPRVSGVLGSANPWKTLRRLIAFRLLGLRDFKLKLGFDAETDRANLRVVSRRLKRGLGRGRFTLRVDVNGGWSAGDTPSRAGELKQLGVCVIEQPFFGPAETLAEVAERCPLPLMADESLLTRDDARTLCRSRSVWWNLRISKNGGLTTALAMARLAEENEIPWTLGCMVGESGILSAAQRRLLQVGPQPRFVEGNYGRLLLKRDLAARSPRFGFRGKLKPLAGPGLGVRLASKAVGCLAKVALLKG